jgi:hypothetical protein
MATIRFSDGRPEDTATDLRHATEILRQLWPSAVIGDEEYGRRLVWRNDRESRDDAGAEAVAEIVTGRPGGDD